MYHVYVFTMSNNHTYFSMNKFSKDYSTMYMLDI